MALAGLVLSNILFVTTGNFFLRPRGEVENRHSLMKQPNLLIMTGLALALGPLQTVEAQPQFFSDFNDGIRDWELSPRIGSELNVDPVTTDVARSRSSGPVRPGIPSWLTS